jgi:hypothetical protein
MSLRPHHHKYKNIILFVLGLALSIILSQFKFFHTFLTHLGQFGYLSAFIAGLLFTSTFTVATGGLILLTLSGILNPILLIIFAGLGAVTCDVLIFKFVKNEVSQEIAPVYQNFINHSHFKKILHTKYFGWTLPVLGTLIIASPLPDELGVSLMGISNLTIEKFIIISVISHTIGISSLVFASITFL